MDKLAFRLKVFKYFATRDTPEPFWKSLEHFISDAGISKYKYLESAKDGAAGIVVQHPDFPDTTFIMFNGTFPKIIQSDLSDLDMFPRTKLVAGKGHKGFTEIYEALNDQIPIEMLTSGTLDVSGHSMGAGVASIYCVQSPLKISELTLFALPPSLNRQAYKYLVRVVPKITSYLNGNDAIFWTTPWPWFIRGDFDWIGEHGWLHGWNVGNHLFKDTKILDIEIHGYISALGYDWKKL